MQIRLRKKKEIDMQVNTINNSNFGARFVAPPGYYDRDITKMALAKIKQISLDNGLSPKIYKKIVRKAHEIFPSNNDLISIKPIYGTEDKFQVAVRSIKFGVDIFGSSTKYCASEFISALRKIKANMARK